LLPALVPARVQCSLPIDLLNQVSDTVIETKSNVQRNFNVKNLKELFQL
jgi:hypothetical protein